MSLSELLEIGLKDLRSFAAKPGCVVYMGAYLEFDEKCHACLAGAVLYETCGINSPVKDTADDIPGWMPALDNLRKGRVYEASFYQGRRTKVLNRWVVDYHEDPELWFKQMEQLLQELKDANE
jgi:hypothetical protein